MDVRQLFYITCLVLVAQQARAVGLFPVPQIDQLTFNATVQYTPGVEPKPLFERFRYTYDLTSGANTVGQISHFFIDIGASGISDYIPSDFEYTKPVGKIPTASVHEFYERYRLPSREKIFALDVNLPASSLSNPTRNGYLMIAPSVGGVLDKNGDPTTADLISPGESTGQIEVTSLNAPTLVDVIVVPVWYLATADENEASDLREQADQVYRDLEIHMVTLGPSNKHYGSPALRDQLSGDIDKMIAMGWISDMSVIGDVQLKLIDIKAAFNSANGTEAKNLYQDILLIMAGVDDSQMRREAIDLITAVSRVQFDYLPDTTIPVRAAMVNNPDFIEIVIGGTVVFRPRYVDENRDNAPIFLGGTPVNFEVIKGPNEGLFVTNQLRYSSSLVGRDEVLITRLPRDDPFGTLTDTVLVDWLGAPDYVVSLFSPPFLQYRGDGTIFVQDIMKNIGNTAGEVVTTTRYYLSETSNIDINTAFELTERDVGPVDVDAEDASGLTELAWPSQFPDGLYYLAACVDADNTIAELNELNNCSFHNVERVSYHSAMMGETEVIINAPPNCDNAVAVPAMLWPPNHKFHDLEIAGVIDVDQDALTIEVTAITQDEPVLGIGERDTAPDGKGIGTSSPSVRAERSGTGDGRVYAVHFKATDAVGNECTGVVSTGAVVHNQGKNGSPAIDSGQFYDSSLEY